MTESPAAIRQNAIMGPGGLLHHRQMDVAGIVDDAEAVEQPQDDHDHDNDVENLFDRRLHRDVGVDQPEYDADDHQSEHYVNEGHAIN